MICIESFTYYLIAINIIGFILFFINTYTKIKQIDILLVIISLLFGSLGIIIAIGITNNKAKKDNMLFRVFIFCMFVIEMIIILLLKGFHQKELTFNFYHFFYNHQLLICYLIIINLISLIAFGIDKIKAISHKYRIKITTLLFLSFIGGSLGALIGMYTFRHKTKTNYFTIGIPLILLMQIIVIFFIMNL